MCLIYLPHGMDPDFPLVLAANRDEFFDRPSAAANFWPGSESFVLAGRDLQAEAPGLASPDRADSPE